MVNRAFNKALFMPEHNFVQNSRLCPTTRNHQKLALTSKLNQIVSRSQALCRKSAIVLQILAIAASWSVAPVPLAPDAQTEPLSAHPITCQSGYS